MADRVVRGIYLASVTSRWIACVGYSDSRRVLAIGFANGTIVHYAGVGVGLFERLRDAPSVGSFFLHHVRGRFPSETVTGPCERCGLNGVIGDLCDECGCGHHVSSVDGEGLSDGPSLVMTPTRVLMRDGLALPPRRAFAEFGVKSDVVFVRDDGWSLGAPCELTEAARLLWADRWVESWTKDLVTGEWRRTWPLASQDQDEVNRLEEKDDA